MATAQKTILHPTFGRCELIPSIIAIRWREPRSREAIDATLNSAGLSLSRADEKGRDVRRDPLAETVNQSTTLTWATGGKMNEASMKRLGDDPAVEWVGPVYRAVGAEGGERSYFAINPTVLILSAAAASMADVTEIDSSATVDEKRTAIMHGFVVYRFPNKNAVEVGQKLAESSSLSGKKSAINFENVPYIAPTCCGCGGGSAKPKKKGKCEPSTTPHIPNDTFFPNQWGLQRINAPNGWPITKGDGNVVVAVLDQGVELLHPDLNLWPISYSTVTHTNDGSPVGNHGTACAGIIAGKMDDSLGVSGLAPECPVMAITTNFADTEVAEGLFYAADNGARVVSMSFGVYPSWMMWNFAIIEAALQYCHDRNVCLIAATGNENQAVSRFPATDPRTLGIGGSNRSDVRKAIGDTSVENWWGACYGPDCDVVAPCLEIPTTDRLAGAGYTPTDYDMTFNGTSSATPHVAALAGLILSLCPKMTNQEVCQTIAETCDKINAGGYTYMATAGKPFGTWTNEVGYGRINVERALLLACKHCETGCGCGCGGSKSDCGVCVQEPEECCVSPCDPEWLPDSNCITWYEEKFFRVPIGRDNQGVAGINAVLKEQPMIEFRLTYEHRMCLLGKQHGPLLYTTTLLPGETVRLYHSDRYRRITSAQARYSVQTTFMQFLQTVHQSRVSNSLNALNDRLTSSHSSSSSSEGGGFFFGLFGYGATGKDASSTSSSSRSEIDVHFASEQFNQSVVQSSLLTHSERSIVVSTYEDKETVDISVRTLHNANECRAVTYFVRQVMELYSMSTRLADIKYRIVFPNVPDEWHSIDDIDWLPDAIEQFIKNVLKLLPKIGTVVIRPRPISLPTDGVVYDPELANCCSCEPEKAASIQIRLEKEKAEAMRACLEVKKMELELKRREMLLAKGELSSFDPTTTVPEPVPVP